MSFLGNVKFVVSVKDIKKKRLVSPFTNIDFMVNYSCFSYVTVTVNKVKGFLLCLLS